MNLQELNTRKQELLDKQEAMIKKAVDNKTKLSPAEDSQFENMTADIADIDKTITRIKAISSGKEAVAAPNQSVVTPNSNTESRKFYAMGGYRSSLVIPNGDTYNTNFWSALKNGKHSFEKFAFENAALGEGGTTADGSALVPIQTDPTFQHYRLWSARLVNFPRLSPRK